MIDVRAVDELITAAESGAEIDAAKYAALLMHPVSEIRRQAGLRPLTGTRDSSAELIQNYLRDALRVIATLMRNAPDVARALFWFRNLPLAAFSYKTPEMLVAEGRASALLSKPCNGDPA